MTSPAARPEFVKAMTLNDATMLVAGSMIGCGISVVSAFGCNNGLICCRRSLPATRAA